MATDEAALVRSKCAELLATAPPHQTDPAIFLGHQFDLGLAWVQFPPGLGGLGVHPALQAEVNVILRRAGAPDAVEVNGMAVGMGGPTVMAHGTEAQKARYLRAAFTGQEIWCQLFSEPGAGSDLAGLATRAERAEGGWIVNGQKVWTTVAHVARWGMLLARTDPRAPKHQGITYFLLDMNSAGVEVRPLYQLTGEAEFNEVFLTDVFVPDEQRLGAVGAGWTVAMTTLMNERAAIGSNVQGRDEGLIGEAVALWRNRPELRTASLRARLSDLWCAAEVLRLTQLRTSQLSSAGADASGSVCKLMSTELNQRITEFTVELIGLEGALKPGGYPMRRALWGRTSPDPQHALLRARANTIEGGTSQIMRNIIAERLLGLPAEPRVDKDIPWLEVPR